MTKKYCTKHGSYYDSEGWPDKGGCPECRSEAEQAEQDRYQAARDAESREEEAREREEAREEAALALEAMREKAAREREEAREEAAREREERAEEQANERAYLINNPGEYKCPYCMLKSLKRGAKRCPKCQHDIEDDYWRNVDAREEETRLHEEEIRLHKEKEACKVQLNWGVERYAKFPNPPGKPVLLPLVEYLSPWKLAVQIVAALVLGFVTLLGAALVWSLVGGILEFFLWLGSSNINLMANPFFALLGLLSLIVGYFCPLAMFLFPYIKAKAANGKRLLENAQQQKAYEEASAAHKEACNKALKAAEPVKAAEDFRLLNRILELDGLIKTLTEKANDV